jgi:hypothetical protein
MTFTPPDGVQPVKPSVAQKNSVLSLSPRDLALLTAVPAVLGRNGVVWFEIGSDGIEISGVGDDVAFRHRSKATIHGSSAEKPGFGVPAGELGSVALSADDQAADDQDDLVELFIRVVRRLDKVQRARVRHALDG